MLDDSPFLKLEEVVSDNLNLVRNSALYALFSSNEQERIMHINYLRGRFPNLRGGTVERDRVVLSFRLENCIRHVEVAPIPKIYMDGAYHYFEIP